MKAARQILPLLMLLCAVVSCREPSSSEAFVRSSMKEADGSYLFSIDMSDSASTYDLRLYTRIDCTPAQFDGIADPEFVMRFVSPSGLEAWETFVLSKDNYSRRGYFSTEYDFPYRSDIVPTEYGTWTLHAKVLHEDRIPGFLGLGLRVSKRENDISGLSGRKPGRLSDNN